MTAGRTRLRPVSVLALAVLAAGLMGYVLPAERVVTEMARLRARSPHLRVEIGVLTGAEEAPERARLELNADRGVRVTDGRGGRWLVRDQRVEGSAGAAGSDWVPDVEVLSVQGEEAISRWLQGAGVDLRRNTLARCGDADCFVLGGRDQRAQLWVDKDQLDVLRLVSPDGRSLLFQDYRDWAGIRFPGRILIQEGEDPIAELEIREVSPAPELEGADFSRRWLERPASPIRP